MKLFQSAARIKSMDEHIIIKKILHGERDEYAKLVDRYHVGLIIYCENIIKDRAQAEDIAQETFLTAYQKLSSYKNKHRFSTWLYKIALNKCYDYLRQRKPVAVDDLELLEAQLPNTIPHYEDLSTAETVRSAVANLQPPEYQIAIEAYYWKGQSYQDIASTMHIPINTVRTYLRRAKEQLRRRLS